MAEALKNFFGLELVESIGRGLLLAHPGLDEQRFVRDGVAGLAALELTERAGHLADVMRRHLPESFPDAVQVIIGALGPKLDGSESFGMAPFRYLPHVLYVSRHGLNHFELSMRAFHALTQRFTAEGGIRPFLVKHPERTLRQLRVWAIDPSVHVRRLVSEGTRPRLPWASRLPAFQADPAPVIELLELLKDDPERYVQRSVANNVNDIAKDHPELVVSLCARWSTAASDGRRWIVKHALRSLIKAGNRSALAVIGAGQAPQVRLRRIVLAPNPVRLGGSLELAFDLVNAASAKQDLVVDYAVHFVKSNGTLAPKVFKLRRVRLEARERVRLASKVSFADLTTRKHYPGQHHVELLVNGERFPLGHFLVKGLVKG
jgi:3-methyladenine DNA glycosylase AlkC